MPTLYSAGAARTDADKTRLTERLAIRFASARAIKFLSYYKPYRGLLIADLVCAIVISVVTSAKTVGETK